MTLARGTLVGEECRVLELLARRDGHELYLAATLLGNRMLKRLTAPAGQTPAASSAWVAGHERRIRAVVACRHPCLARIEASFSWAGDYYVVTEQVQGATLSTVARCRDSPLETRELARWGLALCSLAQALDGPEQAGVVNAFDAAHLIVTPEGQLKLVNFGLTAGGYGSPVEVVSRLLSGLREGTALDARLAWALRIPGTTTVQGLYDALLPLAGPERPSLVLAEPAEKSSKAWTIFGLLLVLGLALGLGAGLLGQGPRDYPAVYVASGSRLTLVDSRQLRVRQRVDLAEPVVGLAGGAGRLYVSRLRGPLEVYASRTQKVLGTVAFKPRGRALVLDPEGQWLFCHSPEAGQIWLVEVAAQKPVARAVLSLESGECALAVGRVEAAPAPPGVTGLSPRLRLFASHLRSGKVSVYQPSRLALLASVPLPGVKALALDPAGKRLVAAQACQNRLLVLAADSLATLAETPCGGTGPTWVGYPEGPDVIWCANASGTLGVISARSLRLLTTIRVGGTPVAVAPAPGRLWVLTRSPDALVEVDVCNRSAISRVELPPGGMAVLFMPSGTGQEPGE